MRLIRLLCGGYVLLWTSILFCPVRSALVARPALVVNPTFTTKPVLLPTVHAAIVEAPVVIRAENVTIVSPGAKNETVTGKAREGPGVIAAIKSQFRFLFQSAHNATSAMREKTMNVTEDAAPSPLPSNPNNNNNNNNNNSSSITQAKKYIHKAWSGASNVTEKGYRVTKTHLKALNSSVASGRPLRTSSADAVTIPMRMTSFIESISSSLEDMRSVVSRAWWQSSYKQAYQVLSRNDSTIVAMVSGKRVYSAEDQGVLKPTRAVFHNQRLTVEVEEVALTEKEDSAQKVLESGTGVGAEYQFIIRGATPIVEEIYLVPVDGSIPGYKIIIPQKSTTLPGNETHAISRTGGRLTTHGLGNRSGHWGTSREEDEYEFLQAQMLCQKEYGTFGILRMLCTCERVHSGVKTRHLLCVSRIADKVVRVARENHEEQLATRIYRSTVRCRNERFGIGESRDCLIRMLKKRAGSRSLLHAKYGRAILSRDSDDGKIVDGILSNEKLRAADFLDFGEPDQDDEPEQKSALMHVITVLVYCLGLVFLVVCCLDINRQYRRHAEGSSDFSRLSDQAQAAYSRLVARS